MPIEDIISSLEEDSKQELNEIRKKKKKVYESLKEEYDQKIESKQEEYKGKLKEELKHRKESLAREIYSSAQKEVLKKKRELLEDFKEEMLKKLESLEADKRKKLIKRLLKKAPTGSDTKLKADKQSLELLKAEFSISENFEISEKPLERQGLYFVAPRKEVDLTFAHLIDVIFAKNEDTLNKILFTE